MVANLDNYLGNLHGEVFKYYVYDVSSDIDKVILDYTDLNEDLKLEITHERNNRRRIL